LGELVEGGGVEDVPPVLETRLFIYLEMSVAREGETRTYLDGVEPTTRRDEEQQNGKSGSPFDEKGVWKF
jgi:hypothetical protein